MWNHVMVPQAVEEYGWAKSSSMFGPLPGHLGKCMSALGWSQALPKENQALRLCHSTRTMPVVASITLRRQNLNESMKECRIRKQNALTSLSKSTPSKALGDQLTLQCCADGLLHLAWSI